MAQIQHDQQKNCLNVSGELTFETVADIRKAGEVFIQSLKECVFDFSKVLTVDSASVALLLAWLRDAKAKNCMIQFLNFPSSLRAMMKTYGVEWIN